MTAILLRVLVLVGPVVALLATGPAGNWPGGWLVALTVVMAVGFAAMPESALGTGAMCVVVVWWAAALDGVHPEAVLAAGSLLLAHLAALLLSYGPAKLPVDRGLLLLWVARGLLVGVFAPAVWLLAAVLTDQPEPPGLWVAGLAAVVVVCVVAAAAVTERAPA